MPIDVRVSRAVRQDAVTFTCGQCDLDRDGRPRNAGDLAAQTAQALRHLQDVLAEAGAAPADLAHLHVFYRNDGGVAEPTYRAAVADILGSGVHPAAMFTPIPAFFYPGVEVEIDAVAVSQAGGDVIRATAGGAVVTRAGDLLFAVSEGDDGQADAASRMGAVLDDLAAALDAVEAGMADLGKLTLYLSDSIPVATRPAVEAALAARFPAPGPVRTTVWLPRLGAAIRLEAMGVADPAGRGAERQSLVLDTLLADGPFSHGLCCGDILFIGAMRALDAAGAVTAPGDLAAQTHAAMETLSSVLAAFGCGFEHLVKVNTYYASSGAAEELHTNLAIRSGYYVAPGPASTGIPVPHLALDGALISVDAVAMRG